MSGEIRSYSDIPSERPESIEELARLYGPVVEYWAGNYYVPAYEFRRSLDDLRQDAWIGVLNAWRNFIDGQGMAFKTFAVCYARWGILDGYRRHDRQMFNARLSDRDSYNAMFQMESLDGMIDDLEEKSFLLTDMDSDPTDSSCLPGIQYFLDIIGDDRLVYVVEQYYCHDKTFADIGRVLGVSRERARQLLTMAHEMLRKRLIAKLGKGQVEPIAAYCC